MVLGRPTGILSNIRSRTPQLCPVLAHIFRTFVQLQADVTRVISAPDVKYGKHQTIKDHLQPRHSRNSFPGGHFVRERDGYSIRCPQLLQGYLRNPQ
ncbi:hypothetical protein PAXRUDRAFT_799858 [Paxillus rubicundulus Ve08.2h10]|uniref:Uncharacterized protein n=1 Tax=Paxillus rubicundulus Ve08.2h10 TaxID=930991 RepID=A0A0D0D371_9AGAM|nr:hypothetical protein PAXRUDRAFT_799858 [Paxillus rubicundulus Ve08.2h10]